MKTRLIRIGNSRGDRIPKAMIEQARLTEEVELRVDDGAVVISAVAPVRSGWAQAASRLAARGEDEPLDEPTATRFDETEWSWE